MSDNPDEVTQGEESPVQLNEASEQPPKAKKKKKSKPKAVKKKAVKKERGLKSYPRGEGVVATILSELQEPEGRTVTELHKALKNKFRSHKNPDSMLTTIRTQLSKNHLQKRFGFELKKTKEEGRGLVYKAPKSVKYDKPVVMTTGKKIRKKAA